MSRHLASCGIERSRGTNAKTREGSVDATRARTVLQIRARLADSRPSAQKPSSWRLFTGRAGVSDPDLPARASVKRELDGGTSAERPRFLRSMLGLEVGVEIGKLEQQPATVASWLELAELHKVVKPVA